jgi:hypothetical protein
MISRESLKIAIDTIDETQLEILHRIILAFSQPFPHTLNRTLSENTNPLKGSILFENDIISPINLLWEVEQ